MRKGFLLEKPAPSDRAASAAAAGDPAPAMVEEDVDMSDECDDDRARFLASIAEASTKAPGELHFNDEPGGQLQYRR